MHRVKPREAPGSQGCAGGGGRASPAEGSRVPCRALGSQGGSLSGGEEGFVRTARVLSEGGLQRGLKPCASGGRAPRGVAGTNPGQGDRRGGSGRGQTREDGSPRTEGEGACRRVGRGLCQQAPRDFLAPVQMMGGGGQREGPFPGRSADGGGSGMSPNELGPRSWSGGMCGPSQQRGPGAAGNADLEPAGHHR